MTWEQGHGTACDCAFTLDTYCTVGVAYMYAHKTHKGVCVCTHMGTDAK